MGGLWGGALPPNWDNTDAEMYAVAAYLQSVIDREGERRADCRVLIISDCEAALEQIETAWRKKRIESGRKGARGELLEYICILRSQLEKVVFVWVPSHEGIAMNAYADAAAKAHLGAKREDVTSIIADGIITRRQLHGQKCGETIAMNNTRIYTETKKNARKYVTNRLQTNTSIMLGEENREWTAVAVGVLHGVSRPGKWDGTTDTITEGTETCEECDEGAMSLCNLNL